MRRSTCDLCGDPLPHADESVHPECAEEERRTWERVEAEYRAEMDADWHS